MGTKGNIKEALSGLGKNRLGLIGLIILIIECILILMAPLLTPYSPIEQNLANRLEPPSWNNLMGTDSLGRDVFTRILYGGRNTLGGGMLALTILTFMGVVIGGLAGYLGGITEWVLMRMTDGVLSFPYLVLALGLAAAFSPSLLTVVIAISLTWWGHFSRVIHGMVLSIRDCEYVESARALGSGHYRIILHHIFPNVLPPILVLASLDLGLIVLAVATLSFLGLGIQPPAPEWGMMLEGSRIHLFTSPHLMIFPGLMIFITVLATNLFGDALRDVLDPKQKIDERH